MDALLNESRRIVEIYWPESGTICVGESGVISIEVEAVNGQMAEVPWFAVRTENGFARYNAACVEGVKYAPDDEVKP